MATRGGKEDTARRGKGQGRVVVVLVLKRIMTKGRGEELHALFRAVIAHDRLMMVQYGARVTDRDRGSHANQQAKEVARSES